MRAFHLHPFAAHAVYLCLFIGNSLFRTEDRADSVLGLPVFRQIRALHQPVHLPDQIHHILVLPAAYRHISSVSAAAAACFVKIGFSAISVLFYSFYFFLKKKKISFLL